MREIKFRALDSLTGKWVRGNLMKTGFGSYIIPQNFISNEMPQFPIDRFTVGQFTGLKDTKGVEIYEGDIIQINFDTKFSEEETYIGVVEYQAENNYPAFDLNPWIDCEMNGLSWLKSGSDDSVKSFQVIGNVHDNPEILEVLHEAR